MITNGRMPGTGSGGGSMGGSGSGGSGGPVFTNTVQLTNPTRTLLSTTSDYKVLPNAPSGAINQEDANLWAFGDVFDRIDEVIPVKISPGVPLAEYVGQLYYDETDSTLYLWDGLIWNPIGLSGSVGGGISAGDTVNALFQFTSNAVQPGEYGLGGSDNFSSGNQLIISNTDQKGDTYPLEYYKVGSQIRVRNVDATGQDLATGEFDGVITAATTDSPDTYRITYDLEFGTGTANGLARVRVAVAITIEDLDDRYVNRVGDTMTGALVMDNATKILMKNTNLDFGREGAANSNGDWDPAIDRFGRIESLPPQLIQPDGTSAGDVSAAFGIRVEIDDGNTFKNQFKVGNRNGDAVTIGGGTGPAITFGSGFPGNQDKVAPGEEGKVRIKGIPTPDFETADDDIAVNKRYVDERDAILQQEIVELEEEIDAIAPSVERGKWRFTAVGAVTQAWPIHDV